MGIDKGTVGVIDDIHLELCLNELLESRMIVGNYRRLRVLDLILTILNFDLSIVVCD